MSNIEKIKAEIERLENMDYPCDTSEQATGFYNALDRISDFIDSLPEDDLPKTKGWVARNKDESLVFCYHKPHRENSITQEWWGSCDADFRIYDDAIDEQFKDLKWEDEPVRVEIAVKKLDSLPEDHFRDSTKMAEDSWMLHEYRETPQGLYSSCYRDGFIAGAKWQKAKDDEETADLMTIVALDAGQRARESMPEDTVIFQKGVAEGRRLEREDRNDDNLPKFYGD